MAPRTQSTPGEEKAYRAALLDDRSHARYTMRLPSERASRGQRIDNDFVLPPAKRYRLATDIENWCRYNSWAVCFFCGCLNLRNMTERALEELQPATIPRKDCVYCSAKQEFVTPKPEAIPFELKGLAPEVCKALSPFEIDCGPEERARNDAGRDAGYRVHTSMIRFSWHALPVKMRIHALASSAHRAAGRTALEYLLKCDQSSSKRGVSSTNYFALPSTGHTFSFCKNLLACSIMQRRV